MTTSPADLSLADLRLALAPAIAEAAAFDGWSMAAVEGAADMAGVDRDVARLAFAGGQMAMIGAWIAHIDAEMARALPVDLLATLPVRERISRLLRFRLGMVGECGESLRRALAIMAMPHNLPATLKLGWASADTMWRLAGDRAADFNHYTKRTTLAAIYAASLAVLVDDTSPGKAETYAFLDRRIAGVMRFEKAKAQFLRKDGQHFSLVRLLGRLRYPA